MILTTEQAVASLQQVIEMLQSGEQAQPLPVQAPPAQTSTSAAILLSEIKAMPQYQQSLKAAQAINNFGSLAFQLNSLSLTSPNLPTTTYLAWMLDNPNSAFPVS